MKMQANFTVFPLTNFPKKAFFVFLVLLTNLNQLAAQENFFENIEITPSTCLGDNGSIQMDEPPSYIDYVWDDGNTNLHRDGLPPGIYTISGEDEDGCIETIILEVPDISDCDFEFVTWQLPGPTLERGPSRPCVVVGFNFTLNGIPVPIENLDIFWTVTVPIPYYPYSYTYYSTEPTIPVYTSGTILDLQVSLNF